MTFEFLGILTSFFDFLWSSFLLLAPMLLLGLFLSGLIHVFISRQAILRWLRDDSLKSVTMSSAIGVPVPLCSCSVVPVVAEMRRKGASRSACMSFLITAPETGADSILVTNAFFGFVVAIVRPVISFITAVVAGIFCIGLIKDDRDEAKASDPDHCHDCDHDHGSHQSLIADRDDCYVSPSQLKVLLVNWLKGNATSDPSPGDVSTDDQGLDFKKLVKHVFRYGFIEIADDILFALLVGVALGGVLFLAIPSDLMSNEYARWLSYPIMVLIGIPLYICASASTPIAAALVAKGVSPGAALIFPHDRTGHQYGHHRDHRQPVRHSLRVHLRRRSHRGYGHSRHRHRRAASGRWSDDFREPRRLPFAGYSTPAMGKRFAPHRSDRLALSGRCPAQRLRGYAVQSSFPVQH